MRIEKKAAHEAISEAYRIHTKGLYNELNADTAAELLPTVARTAAIEYLTAVHGINRTLTDAEMRKIIKVFEIEVARNYREAQHKGEHQ